MTLSKPVERVVQLFEQNGYHRIGSHLGVGSLSFEFSAVLISTQKSNDLIVVVDTVVDSDEARLRRQIHALARALDMVESRRSLTLVIAGPLPREIIVRELSQVCRVLPVGTPTGESADAVIRDALSVLLPLKIPDEVAGPIDPMAALRAALSQMPNELVLPFIEAAYIDASAVEQRLRESLTQGLEVESN